MLALLTFLSQATTATTTAHSKSKGSSLTPLLIIVVLFAVVYLLFIRPRQQRMRQQQAAGRKIGVGDEVMSAGGIFGRVVAIDADTVEVEVAPGVVMTFLPRAVSLRPRSANTPPPPEPSEQPWDTQSQEPHEALPPPEEPPASGSSSGEDRS